MVKRLAVSPRDTKNAIADNFIALMSRFDYYRITVGMIAEEAGINRVTFYNHFLNKEELLQWVLLRDIERTVLPLSRGGDNQLLLILFFKALRNNSAFYLNAINIRGEVSFFPMLVHGCELLSERSQSMLFVATSMSRMLYGNALAALTWQWLEEGMKKNEQLLVEEFCQTLSRPLLKKDA